jgi:hypothetical protein
MFAFWRRIRIVPSTARPRLAPELRLVWVMPVTSP